MSDQYLRRADGSIYGVRRKPHDHYRANEGGTDRSDDDGNMLCNDCAAPLFFCAQRGWYFHVDPATPPCFLAASDHPIQ